MLKEGGYPGMQGDTKADRTREPCRSYRHHPPFISHIVKPQQASFEPAISSISSHVAVEHKWNTSKRLPRSMSVVMLEWAVELLLPLDCQVLTVVRVTDCAVTIASSTPELDQGVRSSLKASLIVAAIAAAHQMGSTPAVYSTHCCRLVGMMEAAWKRLTEIKSLSSLHRSEPRLQYLGTRAS